MVAPPPCVALCDLSLVIADVIRKDHTGEPYVAQDMLLAICHDISAHDLSESEVRELLARPTWEGLPCLDATTTWTILSAYDHSLLIEQAETRARHFSPRRFSLEPSNNRGR